MQHPPIPVESVQRIPRVQVPQSRTQLPIQAAGAHVLPSQTTTTPTVLKPNIVYGITPPASAASIPSIWAKKLSNLFRGRLIVLDGETTVGKALEWLAYYNVSSAPVTRSPSDSTVIGFVSTTDILAFLLNLAFGRTEEKQEWKITREDFHLLQTKIEEFRNAMIGPLVGLSKREPYITMNGELTLRDAVDSYLKSGIHRIAITDNENNLVGVVSQWTIANYIATIQTQDKEWLPMLKPNSLVEHLEYKTAQVITCHMNDTVLDAFLKMYTQGLNALGVVDDGGKLLANLSATDLKGFHLFEKDFSSLSKSVWEFIGSIRHYQCRPHDYLVFVTPKTPVRDVLRLVNRELVHRVYVCDDAHNRKPLGIISLTDLMKGLVPSNVHTVPVGGIPFSKNRTDIWTKEPIAPTTGGSGEAMEEGKARSTE